MRRSIQRRLALPAAVAVIVAVWAAPVGAAFTNFESGHVRPLAMSPDGNRLYAVNTPDNRLAIYTVGAGGLTLAGEVPVGLEPVAVAARGNSEVWVVNHLSDSVSIVQVDIADPAASRVTRTLLTCDEPRDIVFAGAADDRAFVTTARRGQNCPITPNLTTAGTGRAVVQVWNASTIGNDVTLAGTPLATLALFGDTPRALARSADGARVYAAVFHSGNRTTAIVEPLVTNNGGLPPPPAFSTPSAPPTGLIVKFDGTTWRDERPTSNWNGQVAFSLPDRDVFAIDANANPPAPAAGTNNAVGVGTVLFNMAVRPNASGQIYVANTDARNQVRFEPRIPNDAPLNRGVQGHIAESRITVVNPDTMAATPRHLNPHIDYGCTPPGCISPQSERDQSLAFPTDLVFSSDGTRLYVAGNGSAKIGIFDTNALEAGIVTPATKTLVPVGAGPSGLVLDEARNRLYVMNRIDHDISIVSNASTPLLAFESGVVPLRFDPSPPVAREGRVFLYDALNTSGHGDSACASCHIFGDFDSLAWDLGDPFGTVEPNDNPFRVTPQAAVSNGGPGVGIPCATCDFHPMKGPMATQTLRGMAGAGPMHWRGDRTGAATGGDPLDEDLAFKAFNPAFVGLLGREQQLSGSAMQAFTDFILTVELPPNPIRQLTNALLAPNQTTGSSIFSNTATDGGVLTCVFCHRLPFGTDGLSTFEGETQEFKVAHLRNIYQKVGMFGVLSGSGLNPVTGNVGDQVRGFGFLHDGSIATVQAFLSSPVFQLSLTQEQQLEAFMHVFDAGLAASVGQQVSIDASTWSTSAFVNRLNLLVLSDDEGECDLTVKGRFGGEARGAVYLGGNVFQPDRHGDATMSLTAVRQLAQTAGQEIVFTCVPPGDGIRIGIDRDEDGVWDRRELDCGTDPADPSSLPMTLTGPCGPVTTTTTTLAPATTTSSTTTTTTTAAPATTTSTTATTTTVAPTTTVTTTTTLATTTTVAPTTSTTTTTLPPPVFTLIRTTSLTMKDRTNPPAPNGRSFRFKSDTKLDAAANRIVIPARGTAGDPTPGGLGGGATLVVYNTNGSGEIATFTLPASGWSAYDSATVPRGYRYKGSDPNGPVSRVTIKPDKLQIRGGRTNFTYTLNEPSQGRIAVRFQLGTQPAWCADAPAKAKGNPPVTTGNDKVDKFTAQTKTPAPGACPPTP